MSGFYFNQTYESELTLFFPTYNFKFYLYRTLPFSTPPGLLYFQRFSSLNEYNYYTIVQSLERFHGSLVISDTSASNECYQVFFDNLVNNKAVNDYVVAETTDEKVENIYLIISHNIYSKTPAFFGGASLGLFKYSYTELLTASSYALNYLKNLQLSNSWLIKQYSEININHEAFKQEFYAWSLMTANKDFQLDEILEKAQKERKIKKKMERIQKIREKADFPMLECLFYYTNQKSILFLPCGHLVACKECTTKHFDIELGKVLNQRRSPRYCPLCKQLIKEGKEVFI